MNFAETVKDIVISSINNSFNENSLWLRNKYLSDSEDAREFIRHRLKSIQKRKKSCISLEEIKYLCRALKENQEHPGYVKNYNTFIPPKGTLNRWNPDNKIFLYLSCSLSEISSSGEEWNQCELTCINEIRADSNVKISIVEFFINDQFKDMKVLNLDIEEDYLDSNFDEGREKIDEMFDPSKNEIEDIRGTLDNMMVGFCKTLEKSVGEVRENFFLENIFRPIDEDGELQIEYKLFHILAEEIEKLGYVGILYPSTRMSLIGKSGLNLVLFDVKKYCVPGIEIKHGVYK